MKGPKQKPEIWDLFVELAFSVNEALKNTKINIFISYISVLIYKYKYLFRFLLSDLNKGRNRLEFLILDLDPSSFIIPVLVRVHLQYRYYCVDTYFIPVLGNITTIYRYIPSKVTVYTGSLSTVYYK